MTTLSSSKEAVTTPNNFMLKTDSAGKLIWKQDLFEGWGRVYRSMERIHRHDSRA